MVIVIAKFRQWSDRLALERELLIGRDMFSVIFKILKYNRSIALSESHPEIFGTRHSFENSFLEDGFFPSERFFYDSIEFYNTSRQFLYYFV